MRRSEKMWDRFCKKYDYKACDKTDKKYLREVYDEAVRLSDELYNEACYRYSNLSNKELVSVKQRALLLCCDYDEITGNLKNGDKTRKFINSYKENLIDSVVDNFAAILSFTGKKKTLKSDKKELRRFFEEEYLADVCDLVPYYHSHQLNKLHFLKSKKDPENNNVYFGIEIESYGKTENVLEIEEFKDLFSPEGDGSLPDESFELVSEPMTFQFIKENARRIKKMLDTLAKNGQKVNNQCGLHIHVSSIAFKDTEAKIRAIRIVSAIKKELEVFARRKENKEYFEYVKKKEKQFLWMKETIDLNEIISDRYEAVNLLNKNTVEFRFFASTLDFKAILAAVRLVLNIVELSNATGYFELKDAFKGSEIDAYFKKYKIDFVNRIIDIDAIDEKFHIRTLNKIKVMLESLSGRKWNYSFNSILRSLSFESSRHERFVLMDEDVSLFFGDGQKICYPFRNEADCKADNKDKLLNQLVDFSNICDKLVFCKNKKVVLKKYKSHFKLGLVNR